MYNLPVIQYNPISACFAVLSEIPRSDAGIFVLPSIRTQPHRPSRDPPQPREDPGHLWHLRSGHLRKEATEKLVDNVRGIKIRAGDFKDCEACRLGKAHEIVSRRASENRSQQPFWRVSIDLFEYVDGFNDHQYLLVIKDEYSGGIWVFSMAKKNHSVDLIIRFEAWVKKHTA